MMKHPITWFLGLALSLLACSSPHHAAGPAHPDTHGKPLPGKPAAMDTIRWTQGTGKPSIGDAPGKPATPAAGTSYHIAFLLPFLSDQMVDETAPEKSKLALQFYSGAKIALEELSSELDINLVADVWDTQGNDADFQKLMNNPKLEKASVFIGPIRSSHVQSFAAWTKARRKILVSPESPNAGLTNANPDFLQVNPSLRAHCEAITSYVRKKNKPDAVTLVCKQKEAERLTYFQEANAGMGGNGRFGELVVPDETSNFEKIDLHKYLHPGRTSVFILPIWASQDFVMAFLRKLKDVKGSNEVEVYGMPQWRNFESIDIEYLSSLNVHISSAAWIDHSAPEVKAFQEKFYNATGTIPDDDGFNGYDVTLFTGRMLARFGLSFPEHVAEEPVKTLRGRMAFRNNYENNAVDQGNSSPDYLENKFVHILKFDKFGFVPVE